MPTSDRTYPSVWARPPRQGRTTLTRERIVTEAIRLLDTEGIEALSMRKLAAALGAGATSLYWHVANREELIELVIDQVYGEIDVPEPGDAQHWREAARQVAHDMRATVVRHRWLVSVLDQLVVAFSGPNLTRIAEQMLALYESAGFDLPEAERAMSTMSAYVLGVGMSEAAWHGWMDRHGQTAQEWVQDQQEQFEQTTEGFSRLREVAAGYDGKDPQQMMDADFEYGLDRMLDGLQARLDTR
jgi:AcrR family transcriptional regulator